jgi:large subunit ribosomal protein L24e
MEAKYLQLPQEAAKSRRRRQVKSQRAIVGASLDVIKERRAQRPEARSAARQNAIKEGKEKRTAAQSIKKAEKAKTAAKAAVGQSTGRYVVNIQDTARRSNTDIPFSVVGKQAAKGAASKPKPTSR